MLRVLHFVVALLRSGCWPRPAHAGAWTASVDQREGLPVVSLGGATAVSSAFVFWRKDWAWAGMSTEFKVTAPFDYALTGRNEGLDLDLTGRIRKPSSGSWSGSSISMRAARARCHRRRHLLPVRSRQLTALASGEPELLPEQSRLGLGRAGGPRMEMRFDPPLASVYFERGQKSEVRAFFYKGEVPQGQRRHVATLTVSDDMAIGPTTAERFGLDDPATWPTDILDWPIAPWNISPVDLSFLNAAEKPAGKRGFLRSDGDRLVFEDGTPARFWGTNLTAWALFGTDRENVKQQARRLSRARLQPRSPASPRLALGESRMFSATARLTDTKSLSAAMLERLDWWIKCLKDEGIYVWLDLHVRRQFKAGDGIEHFEEIAKGKPTADLKGFNYVNASIQAAMRRFAEDYVSHLNPFTGLRYKDDPAIIALLLTNENDVTHHFGNALLPDKKVPLHNAIYMARGGGVRGQARAAEGQDLALVGARALEDLPQRPGAPLQRRARSGTCAGSARGRWSRPPAPGAATR